MKNLLVITQKVDEQDDLLGFFVGWLREFSKKFNRVFVITLFKGKYNLPENVLVYSLGKEKGTTRFLRYPNFYRFLFKLVPKSDGVFVHMSPIFVVASWPVAQVFRKKIILWYLHRSLTSKLKLAEVLCYKIVTASKESLQLKTKKIIEVGHGIDVDYFKTERNWANRGPLRILSVGRISKIKDYETLIKAAGVLKDRGLDFRLKIVGRPVMAYDFEYFEKLKKLVQESKLENFIKFIGFVPYSQIANYYKEADISINLAPKGGIDKTVLEAIASGSLVLVSNEVFKKYFGEHDLFFKQGDADDLAAKIVKLSKLSTQEIESISNFLVQSVNQCHNLNKTVAKISDLFYL